MTRLVAVILLTEDKFYQEKLRDNNQEKATG